jgi:hypothetical protein
MLTPVFMRRNLLRTFSENALLQGTKFLTSHSCPLKLVGFGYHEEARLELARRVWVVMAEGRALVGSKRSARL